MHFFYINEAVHVFWLRKYSSQTTCPVAFGFVYEVQLSVLYDSQDVREREANVLYVNKHDLKRTVDFICSWEVERAIAMTCLWLKLKKKSHLQRWGQSLAYNRKLYCWCHPNIQGCVVKSRGEYIIECIKSCLEVIMPIQK